MGGAEGHVRDLLEPAADGVRARARRGALQDRAPQVPGGPLRRVSAPARPRRPAVLRRFRRHRRRLHLRLRAHHHPAQLRALAALPHRDLGAARGVPVGRQPRLLRGCDARDVPQDRRGPAGAVPRAPHQLLGVHVRDGAAHRERAHRRPPRRLAHRARARGGRPHARHHADARPQARPAGGAGAHRGRGRLAHLPARRQALHPRRRLRGAPGARRSPDAAQLLARLRRQGPQVLRPVQHPRRGADPPDGRGQADRAGVRRHLGRRRRGHCRAPRVGGDARRRRPVAGPGRLCSARARPQGLH
mmetsp:Transcript_26737/g.92892  ORF Transcript_26737/g.92892 Transcript_26737/m.92892 type:complete len:303 (+) Transcript_26737:659-1567(+)